MYCFSFGSSTDFVCREIFPNGADSVDAQASKSSSKDILKAQKLARQAAAATAAAEKTTREVAAAAVAADAADGAI